jgi:hypothetical protein
MGALAGHLAHLHENLDFTFGELKDLLADVVAGKTPVVEKIDGQNIFFKFQVDPQTGTIRTARNKGNMLAGGMTPEEFASKWAGHPAEDAFIGGFSAIEGGLSRLNQSDLQAIFESTSPDGQRYINAEIVYTGNPNVIVYGGDYVVMHNLQEFDAKGNLVGVQLQGEAEFDRLVQAIDESQAAQDEAEWSIIGPQVIELQDLSDTAIMDDLSSKLSVLGPDDQTMAEFVEEKLRQGPVGSLPIAVNKQEDLIRRIIGLGRGLDPDTLPQLADIKRGLNRDVQRQVSALGTQTNAMKVAGAVTAPVQLAIHDLAVEVLRDAASVLTAGHDEELDRLKSELESAVAAIEGARDAKADARRDMLKRQLDKLGSSENISSSMEGIVFEHPPGSKALYKLTGAFAPLNQIIGASYRIPKDQKESLLRNYVRMAILAG